MLVKHFQIRGTHTTIIDQAYYVIALFEKAKHLGPIQLSPGKIEARVGAKSSSIKLKHINNELYEMVITHNSSRQEFKLFSTATFEEFKSVFESSKKLRGWNINYTDMRQTHK